MLALTIRNVAQSTGSRLRFAPEISLTLAGFTMRRRLNGLAVRSRPFYGVVAERAQPDNSCHSLKRVMQSFELASHLGTRRTPEVSRSASADVERATRSGRSTMQISHWSHSPIERELPAWSVGEIEPFLPLEPLPTLG
ncbi:hypothetical protein C2L65_32840 [Paraburkholderia terrae]|uniref:Uncharacterized protein n=1 Tax=Paraburkholderia terrae TaxID=311230 RepID=A0A2I8EYY2_9BURK|nr:hypothetical protein C2L65_32840 [Paraburkholderia terrae]